MPRRRLSFDTLLAGNTADLSKDKALLGNRLAAVYTMAPVEVWVGFWFGQGANTLEAVLVMTKFGIACAIVIVGRGLKFINHCTALLRISCYL